MYIFGSTSCSKRFFCTNFILIHYFIIAIEEEDSKLGKEEKEAKEELTKFISERENIERLIVAKREQSFNLQTELYEVKAQLAHTCQKSNFQNELVGLSNDRINNHLCSDKEVQATSRSTRFPGQAHGRRSQTS